MKFFRVGVLLLLAPLANLQSQVAEYVYDWMTTTGYFGTSQRPLRKQQIPIPRPRQPWQGR